MYELSKSNGTRPVTFRVTTSALAALKEASSTRKHIAVADTIREALEVHRLVMEGRLQDAEQLVNR